MNINGNQIRQNEDSSARETLQELIHIFHEKTQELTKTAESLGASGNVFEKNAQIVAESTQGLLRYWKQVHLRHAFSGMLVSLVLCGCAFGIFYMKSADRILSQAGVTLKSEGGTRSKKLTLSGKRLLSAGKSESEIVVEFSQ